MSKIKKRILIASGDVGGARAILPVINKLEENNFDYAIINHGYLSENLPKHIGLKALIPNNQDGIKKLLETGQISLYLFTTSVKDSLALKWARYAKRLSVPVVCLLDSAIRIRERMELDGASVFYPDVYALQDKVAYECAVQEGFPKEILFVTGQPALSTLADEWKVWTSLQDEKILSKNKWIDTRKMIVFVSEPVEKDQGDSEKYSTFRGYTEKKVIALLCSALQKYKDYIQIGILPHPREDIEGLMAAFTKHSGELSCGQIKNCTGREAIFFADGICGMASILLYEAWLIGKPVLSLQPGVCKEEYLYINKKSGVYTVTNQDVCKSKIEKWLFDMEKNHTKSISNNELKLHSNSTDEIYKIIENYIK